MKKEDNLKQEINDLEGKISSLTDNRHLRSILESRKDKKERIASCKKEYKKEKKRYKKNLRIKNLLITAGIAVILSPCTLAIGFCGRILTPSLFLPPKVNDVYISQYTDSNGLNFTFDENKDDEILLECPWEEVNNELLKKESYTCSEKVGKENIDSVINENPYVLLKQYSFEKEDTVIYEKKENVVNKEEYKITVISNTIDEEETNKLKEQKIKDFGELEKKENIKGFSITSLICLIPGIFGGAAIYHETSIGDKKKKYKSIVKDEKKQVKQLKKEYKDSKKGL